MRALLATLAATLLTLLVPPGPAAAQSTGCTEDATVTWDSDPQSTTVGGAEVAVPGCADGERVGLQLLTDHGDVPDEPLVAPVADERAVFDLTPLAIRIEPVTGVRVVLHGQDGPLLVEVEVVQRYFNAPGHEQRGLRRTEVLQVPIGGRYVVPAPGAGYATVPCADLGVDTGGALAEGTGVFTVERAGHHLVCHQRTGGGPAEPGPNPPASEVLGESVTRGGTAGGGEGTTAVLGVAERAATGVRAAEGRAAGPGLPRTGSGLLVPLAVGIALVVAGTSTLHTRRRGRGAGPRR